MNPINQPIQSRSGLFKLFVDLCGGVTLQRDADTTLVVSWPRSAGRQPITLGEVSASVAAR